MLYIFIAAPQTPVNDFRDAVRYIRHAEQRVRDAATAVTAVTAAVRRRAADLN